MLNIRVELRWVCSFHNAFYYLLILSCLLESQCQIIRKSIELPVKDYLSSPRTGRNNRDGKDQLYVQGRELDSVRGFEVLSPHTPASALMFAGLIKDGIQLSTPQSSVIPLLPTVNNEGRSVYHHPNLFLPSPPPTNIKYSSTHKDGTPENRLLTRTTSPSTKQLEDGLTKINKGHSFSFSTPDHNDVRGSHSSSQEFIPVSTPFPTLYNSNDAVIGYFNNFANPFQIAREGGLGQINGAFSEYSSPLTLSGYDESSNYYTTPTPQYYSPTVQSRDKGSEEYYEGSKEVLDSHSGREEDLSNSQRGRTSQEYYETSKDTRDYDRDQYPFISQDNVGSNEYPEPLKGSRDYDGPSGREEIPPEEPNVSVRTLPSVPPTIGVIGWKSNTDHHTTWKPDKALIDITDQHIKEDLKNDKSKEASPTPTPTPPPLPLNKEENLNKNENQEKSEEESGEEEDGEEESEEEEGEEESGEEEGDESTESEEEQSEQGDKNELPTKAPPRYENSYDNSGSPEYSQEYQNGKYPPPKYENPDDSSGSPEYSQEYQNEKYPPPKYENPTDNSGNSEYSQEYQNGKYPPPKYENPDDDSESPEYSQEYQNGKYPPPKYENPPQNSGSSEYNEEYQNKKYPPPKLENPNYSSESPKYNQEYQNGKYPPPKYENAPHHSDSPEYKKEYQNKDYPPPKYDNSNENSYSPKDSQEHQKRKYPSPKYENPNNDTDNPAYNQKYKNGKDPPLSYENFGSGEHHQQHRNENEPQRSGGYVYDGQTLPPGPPYFPTSYEHDPRAKHGYLPPPLGLTPYSYNEGIQQTWTPIIPSVSPQQLIEGKNLPRDKSVEVTSWPKSEKPILKTGFEGGDFDFGNWEDFGKGGSFSSGELLKSNFGSSKDSEKKRGDYSKKKEGGDYNEKKVESKDLPVEHRHSRESSKEDRSSQRESSDEAKEETSETNHRSPHSPKDLDEERERNRVSDHEVPRKVPTRIRYPGGGLWAKPPPNSGITLGFVPKKTYTQSRRYNTVKHLPREAALAVASTPEEIVNAPRLREVVSHKKIQEVYEEEGYEDTGYDHGGYKKHGESQSDFDKHHSNDDQDPSNAKEQSEEDAFEEHVAQLQRIPDSNQHDPSGEGSSKKVVQASEKPKVKGSWKQQKTTLNEKSMAFLDGEGKGGILTQKHPPKVEGVVGKYLDIGGKRVPVFQEISDDREKLLPKEKAVSYQGMTLVNQNIEPVDKLVNPGVFYVFPSPGSGTATATGNIKYNHDPSKELISPYIFSGQEPELSQLGDSYPRSGEIPYKPKVPNKLEQKRMRVPFLSSYMSRNNRFSFNPPNEQSETIKSFKKNEENGHVATKNEDKSPISIPASTINPEEYIVQSDHAGTRPQLSNILTTPKINFNDAYIAEPVPPFIQVVSHGGIPHAPSDGFFMDGHSYLNPNDFYPQTPKPIKYSAKFSKRDQSNSLGEIKGLGNILNVSHHTLGDQVKERKSRDLTAFGFDHLGGESDFTHPSAALKAIEEQIFSISAGTDGKHQRSRQTSDSNDGSSGRKYKEIVRNPTSNTESENENRRDKVLNVRLREDELNIRHPFLPRDGSGDVQIDFVQTRTRVQPSSSSSRRKHLYTTEDVESPSATEEPTTTTTTPKVTTVKSTTTTTTEYVPEDPSVTLRRLRNNVFLSSIFPAQEDQEDEEDYDQAASTTTPKITTYRAKTTTEEVNIKETPEEALERLQSNPFLSSVFISKEKDDQPVKEEQREKKHYKTIRRSRPIVVVPDETDVEADSSVKHVEQLTLAQYSGPSNGLMYKQVPMMTQQRISNLAKRLNTEGVDSMHVIVRRSANSQEEQPENVNSEQENESEEDKLDTQVDVEKYPFYFSPENVQFPKYSPLRYATNPKDIPRKTHGGMEFYESRDRAVQCEEPTPPKNIVPKREKDGEWNKNPQPGKQRMGKLGDQIDCLKAKYFAENPLDSPFFKETEVGVPNLTTQSSDDSHGFYSDIIENIRVNTGVNENIPKVSTNYQRQIDRKYDQNKQEELEDKQKGRTSQHFTKSDRKSRNDPQKLHLPILIGSETQESRVINKELVPVNQTRSLKKHLIEILRDVNTNSTNGSTKPITKPSSIQSVRGVYQESNDPIRLHPPKNVMISLKSKGTSNHPKITLIKPASFPYNINIKVMPMSTVGYLKSNSPLHIEDKAVKMLLPSYEKEQHSIQPIYKLDSVSSAASKITKRKKHPTTVRYLTLDSDGNLLHQHIRTFVPVAPQKSTFRESRSSYLPEKSYAHNFWDLPTTDERRGEPKYRVKRNHENDKYINSKESLELKNFLFQKYADILAKERTESKTASPNKVASSTESSTQNIIPSTTSRFNKRRFPPFSSRYSAVDPAEESSSSDLETGSNLRHSKPSETTTRFPIRKPKLRFPKLTMTPKSTVDGERVKYLSLTEPIPVRTSTTSTTTTEAPTSTTTRMYKPRVVYKKEYGKPLAKMVDMFAVLRRQPPLNSERRVGTTTENSLHTTEPQLKEIRRHKPKRLQQFEHRRVTKEEVFRRTYSPHDEIKERSDKVETFDSIYDHPDLRGPVSRFSRDTPPEEDYHEMLVYMINPRTGTGEWKFMPVASKTISRMDKDVRDFLESQNIKNNRRKGKSKNNIQPNNDYLEREKQEYPSVESYVERTTTQNVNEDEYTSAPKKTRSKNNRKLSSRRLRSKAHVGSSQFGEETPAVTEAIPFPQAIAPDVTTAVPTPTYTTLNPKIIMEPHKRKYFYAKI